MKKYCFNCNKNIDYIEKKEQKKYSFRGNEYIIDNTIKVCPICNQEVCLDMDDIESNDFFEKLYNKYLEQYNLNLNSFREIRKKYNLTQEQFSKILGWSKKSINRYENNQSIPQGEYLNLYKKLNENNNEIISIINNSNIENKENILSQIKLDYSYKDCNLVSLILKNKKLYLTQLMKYLFAIDFLSYKKYNNPISSFNYAALPHGPVVNDYKKIIDYLLLSNYIKIEIIDENNILFTSNNYNEKLFNEKELEIIDEVKKKFDGKTASELSDWSHKFIGWKNTKESKIIDFKYAKELNM